MPLRLELRHEASQSHVDFFALCLLRQRPFETISIMGTYHN